MNAIERFERRIWQNPHPNRREKTVRILLAVLRVVMQSRIKLFSNSLTYHTLLAIVPLLAVLFTLLKSFGIERYLKTLVNDMLAPMGSSGEQVGSYLFQFISNAQAGVLGGIGLLFLFYSIFNLFNKVEVALNHLWFIESTRSLKDQALNYLGVIMLVVIIATLALGLNVFLHQDILENQWSEFPVIGLLLTWLVKCLSVLVTAVMLAVLYSGAINTEVNFRAAFIGGLFCALLWLPLTAGFTQLISMSSGYSVIYSSFAGLIILLIWMNILWLLFLSGGLVAYFVQFPALLQPYGTTRLNPAEMEHYANIMIKTIIEQFNAGNGETELADLMAATQLSHRQVLNLLTPFLQQNQIIAIGKSKTRYLPAVNPCDLTNADILSTIRGDIRSARNDSSTV